MTQLWQLWKKTNMNPGDNSCRNYGNSEKSWWHQLSQLWQFWRQKNIRIPFITIVAIMAILKTKNIIRIPFHHNCCNYGNSEKDTVDSWWQQLLQLWQLWKKQRWIPVTTIVAIMAILKNPDDINCRNYGNSEDKKIYGSLFITIFAIMAILKKIQLTPDDSNCCNCGNCGKKQMWIPVTTIVAIMAIPKIAKIASMCLRTAKYF